MEKSEADYNMIDWWKKVVFRNYANFNGRARRAEYWYFVLANFCIIIPFYAVALFGFFNENMVLGFAGALVYGGVALVTLIRSLAVIVRRLLDINKSGWNYFWILIPFIGSILILVWLFTDGNRYDNNYGPDPKEINLPGFDFEQTKLQV